MNQNITLVSFLVEEIKSTSNCADSARERHAAIQKLLENNVFKKSERKSLERKSQEAFA